MNYKTLIAISAAPMAMIAAVPVMAQDSEETPAVETETPEETNGAIVTREEFTEEVPVFDDEGEPVLDENDQPVTETVVTGFTQTVETPSGIVHTVTKEDGSPAVVTHENLGKPERPVEVAALERPDRPDRPDRPERPDRPDRPEKPETPGRP